MKNAFIVLALCCISRSANSQTTFAGGGSSIADGVPATSALLSNTSGVGFDANNIYIANDGGYTIRKVNKSTGLIYTIAGTGVSGYSGDGGQAINAEIGEVRGIYVDNASNVYIADWGSGNRIREVNALTGIITTIAGGGTSTADGVLATNEALGEILCVFVDGSGNLYVPNQNGVGKVDAITGIITTVAGGGTSTADWVPATSAQVSTVKGIVVDNAGNIYITYGSGDRIRKVDVATGLIHTIAGLGTEGTASGIPATSATLQDIHSCSLDPAGNIFIADRGDQLIRRVDATTGIITTIASDPDYEICVDAAAGNMYYSNFGSTFRKLAYSFSGSNTIPSDSFYVSINPACGTSELTTVTTDYIAGRSIKTYFGDGTTDSSVLSMGYINGAYVNISHSYNAPGAYHVKQVLCNGVARQDSLSFSYNYSFCNTLPIKLYNDLNGNCSKDSTEPYNSVAALIQVDSNSIPIDTFCVTGGMYYEAYGSPGDVYSFSVIPGSYSASCPSSGIIYDTISNVSSPYPIKYFGLSCSGSSGFDLAVNDVVPVTGVHDQWGNIYARNNYCTPANAIVTMHYSKHYNVQENIGGSLDVHPTPSSYTDSTITWNVVGLSSVTGPVDLYYAIWTDLAGPYLTPGDTTNTFVTIAPITGDVDTTNNNYEIRDTVKSGCDPNEMSVTPSGCISSGIEPVQLQYTINFMNTGNDTAFNVSIMDTLSDNVNINSLRVVMASNTMNIAVFNDGVRNIAKFDFPQINLLDSTVCPQCSGAVVFNINTRPGLADGATILNHAGVFFDINPVVVTNTVENVIGCSGTNLAVISQAIDNIQIFPNPATDELIVKIDNVNYTSFKIINNIGQTMIQSSLFSTETRINTSILPAGLYYISLKGNNGTMMRKFVKM